MVTLNLQDIHSARLDWRDKAIPPAMAGNTATAIASAGLRILDGDTPMPCAVLKRSALEHNCEQMQRFASLAGVSLAPHGKTTMAPQLFQRQFDAGAWALTAATMAQVRVYRRVGVPRIILANQIVTAADIDWVRAEMERDPAFDFYCLIDSVESLDLIVESARRWPRARPLQVLVELGVEQGRTGCRDTGSALALCRLAARHPDAVRLAGIEAFEGVLPRHPADNAAAVEQWMRRLVALARATREEGLFGRTPALLTAGGSALFATVASELARAGDGFEVVLRSGCYLTHDSHHYELFLRHYKAAKALPADFSLQPALELCARVQSLPDAGRAIVALGKRDASFDIDLPVPLWRYRPGVDRAPRPLAQGSAKVLWLNDHHACLEFDAAAALGFGDIVGFGISHPCTTFDKWRSLYLVGDEYEVVDLILTFF